MLLGCIPLSILVVVACFTEDSICNVVLSSTIALHDSSHHVLWHILIVGEELLGVLRQTVTAITEAWIVVMRSNTRIQTNACNDSSRVESLHFRIRIELIDIADAKSEIGICEEFNSLCLFKSHEQGVNVLLDSSLLQQLSESASKGLCLWIANCFDSSILLVPLLLFTSRQHLWIANDDARRPKVVLQRLALTQELWREQQVEVVTFQCRISQELQRILHV